GGPVRPLDIIYCGKEAALGSGDVAASVRQESHLADVGVAAVIGPYTADSMFPGLTQVDIPHQLLSLTPSSYGAASDLMTNGLMFRIRIIDREIVPIASPFINDFLGARAVADGVAQPGQKLKVA